MGTLTKVFCIFGTNLVILAWTGNELSRRQTWWRTSLSMNKPTTWCKSGWVSLVSSSCLYKTQPERALAQVCHTKDRCIESGRISVPFITSPKFPSFSSNISKVIESLMNLENHEMFLEPSARMDIPSSDGRLSVWTNPQHDASLDG